VGRTVRIQTDASNFKSRSLGFLAPADSSVVKHLRPFLRETIDFSDEEFKPRQTRLTQNPVAIKADSEALNCGNEFGLLDDERKKNNSGLDSGLDFGQFCLLCTTLMPDPNNNIRDSESVIDAKQGQGTDLSFIHNRVVLTSLL
jgi:hypothetical protein